MGVRKANPAGSKIVRQIYKRFHGSKRWSGLPSRHTSFEVAVKWFQSLKIRGVK